MLKIWIKRAIQTKAGWGKHTKASKLSKIPVMKFRAEEANLGGSVLPRQQSALLCEAIASEPQGLYHFFAYTSVYIWDNNPRCYVKMLPCNHKVSKTNSFSMLTLWESESLFFMLTFCSFRQVFLNANNDWMTRNTQTAKTRPFRQFLIACGSCWWVLFK